jgi:hypothetical protein
VDVESTQWFTNELTIVKTDALAITGASASRRSRPRDRNAVYAAQRPPKLNPQGR